MTNEPDVLRAPIVAIRQKYKCYAKLHWTKGGTLNRKIYRDVISIVTKQQGWCFKATRVAASSIDLAEHFAGKPHLAYNRFTAMAVDAALRYPKITAHDDLHIKIDQKTRTEGDNLLSYLESRYAVKSLSSTGQLILNDISLEEVEGKSDDLLQLCDLLTSSLHSRLTPDFCGAEKFELANEIWKLARNHSDEWECQPGFNKRKSPY